MNGREESLIFAQGNGATVTEENRPERSEVIEANMGLVHSCAHKFKGRGIEYDDLFQAGCIGLIKAADGFDYNRGVRFSTYAVPVILGEMKRLFRDGGSVKVSRTLKELSIKAVRQKEQFLLREGREPSISELAQELEADPELLVEALCAAAPTISLTEGDEEGGGQIDLPVESPEDNLAEMLSLRQAMERLGPRDRELIILRYLRCKTQVQTAELLGMTQVQVSRREKKILLNMRAEMNGG